MKLDKRFTIRLEWCGASSPQWVVRFCGDWVGCKPSKAEATALATDWNNKLMSSL